jgi:outer membrane protein OmpA-like peptidoglycan-associated protein
MSSGPESLNQTEQSPEATEPGAADLAADDLADREERPSLTTETEQESQQADPAAGGPEPLQTDQLMDWSRYDSLEVRDLADLAERVNLTSQNESPDQLIDRSRDSWPAAEGPANRAERPSLTTETGQEGQQGEPILVGQDRQTSVEQGPRPDSAERGDQSRDEIRFPADGRKPEPSEMAHWYRGLSDADQAARRGSRTEVTVTATASRSGSDSHNQTLSEDRAEGEQRGAKLEGTGSKGRAAGERGAAAATAPRESGTSSQRASRGRDLVGTRSVHDALRGQEGRPDRELPEPGSAEFDRHVGQAFDGPLLRGNKSEYRPKRDPALRPDLTGGEVAQRISPESAREALQVIGKRLGADRAVADAWKSAADKVLARNYGVRSLKEAVAGLSLEQAKQLVNDKIFSEVRKQFWRDVAAAAKESPARRFFEAYGFPVEKGGRAPLHESLSRDFAGTPRSRWDEFRLTVDHMQPKAKGDSWRLALDPDHLQFTTQAENRYLQLLDVLGIQRSGGSSPSPTGQEQTRKAAPDSPAAASTPADHRERPKLPERQVQASAKPLAEAPSRATHESGTGPRPGSAEAGVRVERRFVPLESAKATAAVEAAALLLPWLSGGLTALADHYQQKRAEEALARIAPNIQRRREEFTGDGVLVGVRFSRQNPERWDHAVRGNLPTQFDLIGYSIGKTPGEAEADWMATYGSPLDRSTDKVYTYDFQWLPPLNSTDQTPLRWSR